MASGALPRTEAGLTEGADVFEGRKAGMGVMEVDVRDALGGGGGAGGGRGARRGGGGDPAADDPAGGEHEEAARAGGQGGVGLAAEDGGRPDRGGGRVRSGDCGHGRDGGGRAGCARRPGGSGWGKWACA